MDIGDEHFLLSLIHPILHIMTGVRVEMRLIKGPFTNVDEHGQIKGPLLVVGPGWADDLQKPMLKNFFSESKFQGSHKRVHNWITNKINYKLSPWFTCHFPKATGLHFWVIQY